MRACLQQRDRAVDAAAHRDRHAAAVARRVERRRERIGERVCGQQLAADRGRLEQGQAAQVAVEARRVGIDDQPVLDLEAHGRPIFATSRIADELRHGARVLGKA